MWFITVPTDTDPYRVYDQVFIDGTYFHKKCLLVACTKDHVIAWHWCLRESSNEYLKLLDKIAEPLVVTTDGLRLPSFSGHPICADLVSVGEDVHCESTAQEIHAGVPA